MQLPSLGCWGKGPEGPLGLMNALDRDPGPELLMGGVCELSGERRVGFNPERLSLKDE